jgi:hypothetical protein
VSGRHAYQLPLACSLPLHGQDKSPVNDVHRINKVTLSRQFHGVGGKNTDTLGSRRRRRVFKYNYFSNVIVFSTASVV